MDATKPRKARKITPETAQRRLEEYPDGCPYCRADIDRNYASDVQEGALIHHEVECETCGSKWLEEYRLVGVFKSD